MTVRGRSIKRNQRIRKMLLDGYPVSAIARFTRISETRVRQIRDLFIDSGELMAVPHTKPIIYIDPHAHALGEEFSKNDGGAENNGPTRVSSPVRDSLPPNGRLPFGMTNGHISGRISMTVRKKGDFSDVRGPDGLYVGYWDKPGSGGKGKTHRKCHLRLFRQELTVNFYESSKGTMEFYVNPGRVYYYPAKISQAKVVDYILERVLFVGNLLKANGWQVTDPQLPKNYQLHCGKEGDPMAALIPPRYHDENQDIISDTSPDYLETELEHATDDELVRIYANMPGAIAEAKHDNAAMKADIAGLREVIHLQGEAIAELVGNVTALTRAVTDMASAQTATAVTRFSVFTGEGYQ